MEQEQHFIDYIEQSIIRNWNLNALTDYKGATLQYKDVARKIAKFHIVLESAGIQPGDKIAVCGRNSAHWAVTFLATITYGAVIVPILHEFKAELFILINALAVCLNQSRFGELVDPFGGIEKGPSLSEWWLSVFCCC